VGKRENERERDIRSGKEKRGRDKQPVRNIEIIGANERDGERHRQRQRGGEKE
jgi:hypothetical protein